MLNFGRTPKNRNHRFLCEVVWVFVFFQNLLLDPQIPVRTGPLIHPTKNKGKKTARYITTCSMLGNIYQGHFPLVHVVIVFSYQAHLGNHLPSPCPCSRMLDWWRARFVSSWPLPAHGKQVCASDWCKFFTVFFTLSSKPRWRWLEIHLFQKERQTTHSWSTFQPAMLGPYRRMRTHSLGSQYGLKRMLIQSRGITTLFCSIIFYQPLMDSITFSEYDDFGVHSLHQHGYLLILLATPSSLDT